MNSLQSKKMTRKEVRAEIKRLKKEANEFSHLERIATSEWETSHWGDQISEVNDKISKLEEILPWDAAGIKAMELEGGTIA